MSDQRLRDAWAWLADEGELSGDGLYPFELEREGAPPLSILVIQHEGELYALQDECPHRHIKISEQGYIDPARGMVVCGWHHWGFHLETGAFMLPTGVCVPVYLVKVDQGALWVMIP